MTIVLKTKNEEGYNKIIENVLQVKELDNYIAFTKYGDWTLYKSVLKSEVERIVM